MKFLIDQNISRKLLVTLGEMYPGTDHVVRLSLDTEDDFVVWKHAGDNGFTLLSKDKDLADQAYLHGPPPKLVWVRLGNCSTQAILDALKDTRALLGEFDADPDSALLVLPPGLKS